MIISQLTGGLGNQMFQYAFGFSLARRLKTEFRHRFVSFQGDTPRNLELDNLTVSAKQASLSELSKIGYPPSQFSKIITRIGLEESVVKTETSLSFQKEALNFSDNSYIQGYWQSEKYFIEFENDIRKEFRFKVPSTRKNDEILKEISNNNSVSVHVRRGDYVADAKTNAIHGTCDLKYYEKAMALIEKKIKNPVYFFFSDDPEWVKMNLKSVHKKYYVDWNQGNLSYIDMHLMSNCKHNIIANSSFSWWGAWLNKNPDKNVIAPKKWFKEVTTESSDRFPESWILV